jgi:hypothetical protein
VVAPARNFRGEMQPQMLEECFRCNETGSTVAKRLETTTYIPSFQIPNNLVAAVKVLVSEEYDNLITDTGLVQIYMTAMGDLQEEFKKAEALNITYQPPMVKSTLTTMADKTNFKKRNADNAPDNGLYAAREAYKVHGGGPWRETTIKPYYLSTFTPAPTPNAALAAALAQDFPIGGSFVLPQNAEGVTEILDQFDPSGLYADANCDDPDAENVSEMVCVQPTEKLFDDPTDIEAQDEAGAGVVASGTVFQALSFSVLLLCALAFA